MANNRKVRGLFKSIQQNETLSMAAAKGGVNVKTPRKPSEQALTRSAIVLQVAGLRLDRAVMAFALQFKRVGWLWVGLYWCGTPQATAARATWSMGG